MTYRNFRITAQDTYSKIQPSTWSAWSTGAVKSHPRNWKEKLKWGDTQTKFFTKWFQEYCSYYTTFTFLFSSSFWSESTVRNSGATISKGCMSCSVLQLFSCEKFRGLLGPAGASQEWTVIQSFTVRQLQLIVCMGQGKSLFHYFMIFERLQGLQPNCF